MLVGKQLLYYRTGFAVLLTSIIFGFAYTGMRDKNRLENYLNDDFIFTKTDKSIVDVKSYETSQGAKTYFAKHLGVNLVDIEVIFDAGSTRDGEKPGLSELAFLTLNFNNQANNEKIFAELDEIGATLNIKHERDKLKISIRTLNVTPYLQQAVTLLAQAISLPNFSENALLQAKNILNVRLKDSKDSAESLLYRNLYSGHPYANKDLVTTTSLLNISLQDVINFHKQYYVAKNACMAIVGNITDDVTEGLAEKFFSHFDYGNKAASLPVINEIKTTKEIIKKVPNPSQTQIIIAALGVGKHNANFFPFLVGNYMLSSSTSYSRLIHKFRTEQGLAYEVDADYQSMAQSGPFWIEIVTRTENTDKVLKDTKQILHEFIKNGPTEDEMKIAKRHLIGSLPLCLANSNDIANILAEMAYYNLLPKFIDNYQTAINAVTPQQVKDVFQEILNENKLLTIMWEK